jgi:gamma-glutamyltranspeptidase/glutathione hydrolase
MKFFASIVLILISTANTQAAPPIQALPSIANPVWSRHGMVAAPNSIAANVGLQVLKHGGNAVDAAIAVAYSLAVTYPKAGNLGGGGFMLVYDAKTQSSTAIDYREAAPQAVKKKLYLDDNDQPVPQRSQAHGLAVGVPGTVAGLELAREMFGSLPRTALIKPAYDLARNGFIIEKPLAQSLNKAQNWLRKHGQKNNPLISPQDQPFAMGHKLLQPRLANTLKAIINKGFDGFYKGKVAKSIVHTVKQAGGVMLLEDLSKYQAKIRQPIQGEFKGYEVVAMPPPSSGGVHLIQLLQIMSHFPIKDWGHNSALSIHVMVEAMKHAYADRSLHLGDPDMHAVPTDKLIHPSYGKKIAQSILLKTAMPSAQIAPKKQISWESEETTHFSIVDAYGNAVSNTYTLNFSYGSGIMATKAGVLLNNEMDDFSYKEGVANAYGLLGGQANLVAAQKRPLSSMTPFFVLKDNQLFLVGGTPGGSRIITTNLQIVLNILEHGMNVAEATQAVRIHHQWYPDEIRTEPWLSRDTIQLLMQKGHKLVKKSAMGDAQSIVKNENGLWGASDPRGHGVVLGY